MDFHVLAEELFQGVTQTPLDMEKKYPKRDLPKKAQVTRMAPSPTGFIHLGNLYSALADERIAHKDGGVFYLRIEDTDEKRKVEGAVETIIDVLRYFEIEFDEGAGFCDSEPQNAYAPYFQRQRVDIYHVFAKELVKKGLAYPCFCTQSELEEVRKKQEENQELTGYYGKYATCRELTLEQIKENLKNKKPYVLRLRSGGTPDGEIVFRDAIKGDIKMPENMHDIVLLKSDGVPTYHFAHAVDDHLMHTTVVIRGGEWLASAPIHVELFSALGFALPIYAHTAHLMKFDEVTGGKRKLSKRKDPELSLDYYRKDGYHPYAMKVYLLTLLNSNFEEWHEKYSDKNICEFPFSIEKMSQSGALFDTDKLANICKEEFSKLSEDEMYDFLYDWAGKQEISKKEVWFSDKEKLRSILRLYMGIGQKRRRKDFICAKQIFDMISYFFENPHVLNTASDNKSTEKESNVDAIDASLSKKILEEFIETYDKKDDSGTWFDKIKAIAQENGYATDMKAYKANAVAYPGSVTEIAQLVRIAVTGRTNTPDLYAILSILGKETITDRIDTFLKYI